VCDLKRSIALDSAGVFNSSADIGDGDDVVHCLIEVLVSIPYMGRQRQLWMLKQNHIINMHLVRVQPIYP
jgi:hypothetical protein